MSNAQDIRKALERIKAHVVGDARPHWDVSMETTASRGYIADLCDAALAQPQAAQPVAPAELRGLDTATRVRFYEHDFYVLSNFSAFTLQWKGIRFDTSEAAYHWEKFLGDSGVAQLTRHFIQTAPSAHEAFKIAEQNKEHRRADWNDVKVGIMLEILRAKAAQHEYVRRKLLATGDRELVEDSWRDDFWGWGPNRDGKNTLGRLWMQVRAELRIATPPTEPAPQAEPATVGELPPLPATDEWIDALVMEYRQRIYPQDMHPHFERALVRAALASAPHAREPLNFDRLQSVMAAHFGGRELTDDEADSAEAFARAVERAHGIG